MGFKFVLTNPEAMVSLPPGRYQSRLVEATWDRITVECAGRPFDPDDPCLLPLTVHDEPAGPGVRYPLAVELTTPIGG